MDKRPWPGAKMHQARAAHGALHVVPSNRPVPVDRGPMSLKALGPFEAPAAILAHDLAPARLSGPNCGIGVRNDTAIESSTMHRRAIHWDGVLAGLGPLGEGRLNQPQAIGGLPQTSAVLDRRRSGPADVGLPNTRASDGEVAPGGQVGVRVRKFT